MRTLVEYYLRASRSIRRYVGVDQDERPVGVVDVKHPIEPALRVLLEKVRRKATHVGVGDPVHRNVGDSAGETDANRSRHIPPNGVVLQVPEVQLIKRSLEGNAVECRDTFARTSNKLRLEPR